MTPASDPRRLLPASIVLVLAVPVATWWLVGDMSEDIADPDYMFHPIELPGALELALGLGSTLAVIACTVVLGRALRRHELDRHWLAPFVFLAAAGALVGFGWRVVTAGVGGANIGGGMMMLFGLPLVGALVIGALVMLLKRPGQYGRARPTAS